MTLLSESALTSAARSSRALMPGYRRLRWSELGAHKAQLQSTHGKRGKNARLHFPLNLETTVLGMRITPPRDMPSSREDRSTQRDPFTSFSDRRSFLASLPGFFLSSNPASRACDNRNQQGRKIMPIFRPTMSRSRNSFALTSLLSRFSAG